VEFEQNAKRIGAIGKVFPAIFFLVAALISLTTMTRMVEEERIQIGTLKGLGYSKISIAMKYILYALLATLGRSIFGALDGLKVLPTVIITAYQILYPGIPEVITPFNTYYALLATILAVLCVGIATFVACYKELLAKPADLMRPEAPKIGKRVLIERIPFIWNKLNFTWKATVRNLMRYKKRFFMTIFGIGGCMALLLVGFGLKDSIFVIYTRQFDEIMIYDASASLNSKADEGQIKELEDAIEADPDIKSSAKVRNSSVEVSYKGKSKSLSMIIPEDPKNFKDYIVLRSRVGHKKYTLNDDGVILTEQAAKKLGVSPGDTITIKEGDNEAKAKVVAITENYMTHYVYMTPDLYESVFHKEMDYNEYFLRMPDVDEDTELAVGNNLLKYPAANGVFYTSYYQNLLSHVLVSLNIVVWVLIVAAGALAFVVLYNLNNININERRRELATIKVLGFFNKELGAYVYRENILLTIIGAIFGTAFGIVLHRFVIITVEIDLVMFGRNIDPSSFVYSIFLTFLFSALVNFVMFFKLKKIDMVESLKSVE
jgi:putative ABC transport system permease protein